MSSAYMNAIERIRERSTGDVTPFSAEWFERERSFEKAEDADAWTYVKKRLPAFLLVSICAIALYVFVSTALTFAAFLFQSSRGAPSSTSTVASTAFNVTADRTADEQAQRMMNCLATGRAGGQ